MTDKCETDINLRTLRHIDDSIEEILLFGGQVAVYKYSFTINEWERKEIEGSMFVIRRKVSPNYAFVVINRLNTTNMFQTLSTGLDTKVQVPYLLYKNAINEIFCIWFYNESDCVHIGNKLQEIINKISIEKNLLNPDHKQPKNDIFKRLLSVDLNSSDADKLQRNSTNGQNSLQTQTQTPSHPQRRTLQVKDLFESQMASLSIAPKPVIPQESSQQNLDDCILNDVITPAMLTDQSSTRPKPNTSEPLNPIIQTQKISHSPIIFTQPQQQPILNTSYGINYPPVMPNMSNTDRCGTVQSLTMEQLKQTMIHLLQTDADFLHSIHNAYIASVNRK